MMRPLFALMVFCMGLSATSNVTAKNIYHNSSFELGITPTLSAGENHLVEGSSRFGENHAVSRLDIQSFAAVPVPEGATSVTFAIYLRGESLAPIRLGIRGNAFSRWNMGPSIKSEIIWRRHHFTVSLDPNKISMPKGERAFVAPFILNKKNINLHMDGVQIEFGGLTDYEPRPGIETGVWTGRYGNVFDDALPVTAKAGIENNSGRTLHGHWRINVKDHKGKQVFSTRGNVVLAHGARMYKLISLGDLPLGHYTLESAVISNHEQLATRRMTFCRIDARSISPSDHFGMHSRYVSEADPKITQERWKLHGNVGAGWARIFCSWAFVESEKDKYNWQHYDSEIDSARAHGKKVLAVFYNRAPKWARGNKVGLGELDLAAFITARMRFRRAFIERYADKVEAWELFNEPYWFYSADRKRGLERKFLTDYSLVHKKTYEFVKELDHGAQTLGNLCGFFERDRDYSFLKAVAAAGLLEYMDVLSMHDYRYKMSSEQLKKKYAVSLELVKKVLTKNGKPEMPIWQTESAVRSDDLMDFETVFYERPQWMLKDFLGEWQAARNYAKAIFFRFAGGIRKDFYFNFSQSGIQEPLLAVFRNRWEEPKVIYPVQYTLAKMIGDADFVASANDEANGLEIYVFRGDADAVAAYWSDKVSGKLHMDADGLSCSALTVNDLMGNGRILAIGRNVILPLNDEPHFLYCKTSETIRDTKLMLVRLRNTQILAR